MEAGHYGDFDARHYRGRAGGSGQIRKPTCWRRSTSVGDEHGIKLGGGKVTTAPGWPDAYRRWTGGGWNAVSGPEDVGGQGLPLAINAACTEIWSAANIAFGLCPLLTATPRSRRLRPHGSEELKTDLSRKADLRRVDRHRCNSPSHRPAPTSARCAAAPSEQADGSLSHRAGTKIFITYGEHDMTDNIVHFVLARLPDAPAGTKGISLFLVPKFLVNADGSLGARNDIYRERRRTQARHARLADLHA